MNDILKYLKEKFLFTLNGYQQIREWYKDVNMNEVQVPYSVCKEANGRKKYGELIITNY